MNDGLRPGGDPPHGQTMPLGRNFMSSHKATKPQRADSCGAAAILTLCDLSASACNHSHAENAEGLILHSVHGTDSLWLRGFVRIQKSALPVPRSARARPRLPGSRTKKGRHDGRPCMSIAIFGQSPGTADFPNTRYCSFPTKPNLVMPLRFTTASVWSTMSYIAVGAGWNCSSGSGLIDLVCTRYCSI